MTRGAARKVAMLPMVIMVTMRVGLLAGVAVLLAPAAPRAQTDPRVASRAVVAAWQDAVINVRVVLKMRMSMGGREVQSSDDPVDTVGTVIDPAGLTVLSLGSLNPGAMMSTMMGGSAGGDQELSITTEPSDVRMRLADGREIPARIVLRDEDLNLAFLRPTTAPDKPLVALDLSKAATPALLDPILVLSRLARVGGWAPGASLHDVGAIVQRPRTFFVLTAAPSAMGTPAFTPAGAVVGVLTMRQIDPGRPGTFAGMGGTDTMGLLPVVVPAADVLEVAKQAPGR